MDPIPAYRNDRWIDTCKFLAVLFVLAAVPPTSEGAMAMMLLMPFAVLLLIASGWIFGRKGVAAAEVLLHSVLGLPAHQQYPHLVHFLLINSSIAVWLAGQLVIQIEVAGHGVALVAGSGKFGDDPAES